MAVEDYESKVDIALSDADHASSTNEVGREVALTKAKVRAMLAVASAMEDLAAAIRGQPGEDPRPARRPR